MRAGDVAGGGQDKGLTKRVGNERICACLPRANGRAVIGYMLDSILARLIPRSLVALNAASISRSAASRSPRPVNAIWTLTRFSILAHAPMWAVHLVLVAPL